MTMPLLATKKADNGFANVFIDFCVVLKNMALLSVCKSKLQASG